MSGKENGTLLTNPVGKEYSGNYTIMYKTPVLEIEFIKQHCFVRRY
jgi:hypothetical protein